jgi:hypothetical protein
MIRKWNNQLVIDQWMDEMMALGQMNDEMIDE